MAKQPKQHGLYRPEAEHDACGVGFIANIRNQASHSILIDGLKILENMAHRGAVGANLTTGDGAGVMVQIPHDFLSQFFDLPKKDIDQVEYPYAIGMMFLPQSETRCQAIIAIIESTLEQAGMVVLGWRDVPVNNKAINSEVRSSAPVVKQVLIGVGNLELGDAFERRLFIARKVIEKCVAKEASIDIGADVTGFYCVSMSSRTLVYKGMFLADQLLDYYPDLCHTDFTTAMALVHQRFSTNTFPAWKLAHPFRFIAHNGEINTLRCNVNNMFARHHSLHSPLFGESLEKAWPLIAEGQSDTASLDNAVELLYLSGYSLAHAMAILIPEAWQNEDNMSPQLKDFYRYHAPLMEPWDGPAEVIFSDGKQIGAVLDRNGLRPGRYWLTDDDRIIMASEAGVLNIADTQITHKWRIQPGKILLIDLEQQRLVDNVEIKENLANLHPYDEWIKQSQHSPLSVNPRQSMRLPADILLASQHRFGYTEEDIKFVLRPMVQEGVEPTGSMGDDAPLAVLSSQMKPLSSYFRQEFSQVTNPAIDPIREGLVMSLNTYVGARPNLLSPDKAPTAVCVALSHPILTEEEFTSLLLDTTINAVVLDITFAEQKTLQEALDKLQHQALSLVEEGAHVLILSDRLASENRMAIPAVLAAAAVHQRLVTSGDRTSIGLVVETGSARSVHDMAVLTGYGVEAIYPYLAYETILSLTLFNGQKLDARTRLKNYRQALGKGLLKVMSKMGIATFQSYCGAQIFEAMGLSQQLIDQYFRATVSNLGGIGLTELEQEARYWHEMAKNKGHSLFADRLVAGGDYAVRTRGEVHMWTPESISALQHSVRSNQVEQFQKYSTLINEQTQHLLTLRGMLDIRFNDVPVDLSQVEPAANIVRHFSTGAMSLGSLSNEAHRNLAIAMNRIGGKSNTGEGGEESIRFLPLENGDSARSAIKQVASGRFGVTAAYLANSDMIQIKIAQGAKPGEGGQLPGHKVDSFIADLRYSVPGVGLISPPPHHDIYSIEDIAQLIYDLKCANPQGKVSVKLVSRDGVGTVAAGVVKAKADHVTIAGHDGGTGASPLSSIKHAGTPWELGLSETHQTLVLNDLRGRVALQVDGQIKTGRDVVIGALLGADEFGFATAPLVAQGCIMMRKCHLNTCPVGIATQDPILRKKFAGKPEHIVNYFFFIAEEVRCLLAMMGVRYLKDIIGRVDLLYQRPHQHWKGKHLDFTRLLTLPEAPSHFARYHCTEQSHQIETQAIDYRWLTTVKPAIENRKKVVIEDTIQNTNRSVGAVLSNAIANQHGHSGLADDTITINLKGVAGQSFGAFLSKGVSLSLEGEANDYLGKGLSGGIVSVFPPSGVRRDNDNIIVGNTVLYGGVCGEIYCRGVAGERFAVRNSGAHAVVEGCGDHGCEYMTGGTVLILGEVGRNFAAGMSGGVAYVFDEKKTFSLFCNHDMVDVRPIECQDASVLHLGYPDYLVIQQLLAAHVLRTHSPQARNILENWFNYKDCFLKVIPYEYERSLQRLAVKTA